MAYRTAPEQTRILNAVMLLVEGRRITDVAAQTGYRSLSAFAKFFAFKWRNCGFYRRRAAAKGN